MYQNAKRTCGACRGIVFAHYAYCVLTFSLPSTLSLLKLPIDSDGVETVWLEIRFPNNSKLLISSLYRPPNVELKDLSPKLECLLDHSSRENIETMLLGDLNYDVTTKKRSSDTKELCKLFNIYQFTQLIKSPTRITQLTSTTLDLIFTTSTEKIRNSGVLKTKARYIRKSSLGKPRLICHSPLTCAGQIQNGGRFEYTKGKLQEN